MSSVKSVITRLLFMALAIGLSGCYPALEKEAQSPEEALIPIRFFYPKFYDDMDQESLILAIKRNTGYLNRLDPDELIYYGPHKFTCRQVKESQEAFLKLISENPDPDQLNKKIKNNFQVYRAAGRVGNKKVLFTGYFEPVYDGSLVKNDTFKHPLYRKPDDLVIIDLSLFNKKFKGQQITARIEGKKVLPYYSKYEIEKGNALKGRRLFRRSPHPAGGHRLRYIRHSHHRDISRIQGILIVLPFQQLL